MKRNLLSFALFFLSLSGFSQTAGTLSVSVTTASTGMGYYEPLNVEAIWVEDSSGAFIKTLLKNGFVRDNYLDLWYTASEGNLVDAISGATRPNHDGVITCSWQGTDTAGNVVADGNYKLHMQLTDDDFSGVNATFNFTKGNTPANLTPADVLPSFKNVTIDWMPANTALNNVKLGNLYSVYPNPTKSSVYINGIDIKKTEIYTLSGKSILKTNSQKINLSALQSGTYLAYITTGKGILIKKIIKE